MDDRLPFDDAEFDDDKAIASYPDPEMDVVAGLVKVEKKEIRGTVILKPRRRRKGE